MFTFEVVKVLLLAALLGLPVWAAEGPEDFAGLTLGQSHREIAAKVDKRENLVGPGKSQFDEEGRQATTYRYTGSFNRDRQIDSVMLYFTSRGTLAGFDLFITSGPTFDRYQREVARRYEKIDNLNFAGQIAAGRFAKLPFTVELVPNDAKKAKFRSYAVQFRCPDILRREHVDPREEQPKAEEPAAGKPPATPAPTPPRDPVLDAIRRAL